MSTSRAPTAPQWTSVREVTFVDLLWLTLEAWREAQDPTVGGIAATMTWLGGSRPAPITNRAEGPVSRALAEAERAVAQMLLDVVSGSPRYPVEAYCVELGVGFVAPRSVSRGWAEGVHATLRWVLGHHDINGAIGAPLLLPDRRADGSLTSAQEIYEREVARASVALGPEQRASIRRRAEATELRSRWLAARVRDVQQAADES